MNATRPLPVVPEPEPEPELELAGELPPQPASAAAVSRAAAGSAIIRVVRNIVVPCLDVAEGGGGGGWGRPQALTARAAGVLVDVDGRDEHDADGDLLPVRRDVDDDQAGQQDRDDQRADDRAEDLAAAAEQA